MADSIIQLDCKKPPISDVEVGIDRVYAAHNGRRIKVFDTLEAYFDEKASYAKMFDDAGEATDEIEDMSITISWTASATFGPCSESSAAWA